KDGQKGDKGDKGDKGPQGIRGPAGANGQSQYVHMRYSANSNGSGFVPSPNSNTKYIGIAVTTSSTAPTGASSYTWSKFIGENGSQGIQGPAGPSGKTTYTWVKYADEKDGTGISDSPSGKMYIGLAFNKTTQTESTNPKDYQWSAMYDEEAFKGIGLADKTDILSGTEIYTDKADDDSVVHVEVDGKSVLQAPVGESAIDGIEIGGRNLISESLISSSFGDMDKSEYVSKVIIRFSSSAQYGGVRITAHPLLPNTEYVMRYRYKKTSGTLVSFGGHTDASWSNNKTYVDGIEKGTHAGTSSGFVSDDDIEHEVVVYINTPDEITVGDLFYIQPNRGNTTPVSIDIYDLKLEKGTKATDWTPAPEDVEDNIQSVNNFDIVSSVGKRNLVNGSNDLTEFWRNYNGAVIKREYEDMS